MKEAIGDYILNPCHSTAKKMLETSALSDPDAMAGRRENAGVLLAVIEESRRIGVPFLKGPIYWTYLILLGWIGRPLTWKDSTWNDYHGLRWSFRQDAAAIEALHTRRHSRDAQVREDAQAALIKLFRDPDFRTAYLECARAYDCGECRSTVRRYEELDGVPGLPELERAMRSGDAA